MFVRGKPANAHHAPASQTAMGMDGNLAVYEPPPTECRVASSDRLVREPALIARVGPFSMISVLGEPLKSPPGEVGDTSTTFDGY